MVGRNAMCKDSLPVKRRRITLVPVPSVNREFLMDLFHILVAEGFCQDRSGCNRVIEPVSLYYGPVPDVPVRKEPVPVDQEELRLPGKALYREVHRLN